MIKYQLKSTNEKDWLNEIDSLSSSSSSIVLETPEFKPSREAFLKLIYSFEDHYLSYRYWNDEIIIKEGIKTSKILERKDLMISAARKFRESAHQLMQKLASRFNLDYETGEGLKEIRILNNHRNQISDIDEEWKFFFHGYECMIKNKKTGQIFDMIFITRPEFGVLDPYFFLKYVNTTPEWIELKKFFKGEYDNIDQALLTLEAYGHLVRFEDELLAHHFSSRGLIVKEGSSPL